MSPDFEDVVNDELHEYYGLEWSKQHRFTMIKLFNYMKVTSDTATESWAWLPQHQRRSPHGWFTYSIWAGQIAMEINMNMSLPTAMKCANWSRIFKHTWIHKMGTTLHWWRRDTSLGSWLSSVRYITSRNKVFRWTENFEMDRFHSNRDTALSLVRDLCLHGMQREFRYISSITTDIEWI